VYQSEIPVMQRLRRVDGLMVAPPTVN